MTLFKKEWKLVMMPVPLLFLLLSGLVLIQNYQGPIFARAHD